MDASRKAGRAASQGGRCNLDDDFIEQARVVELVGQVATTDNPAGFVARRDRHCLVNRAHVTPHKPHVCPWHEG